MANEPEAVEAKAAKWPYTSFKTLLNFLAKVSEGAPPRIDRSFLTGSEGSKTQVLAMLKFFGLVKDDDNKVSPLLQELASNENARPKMIRDLVLKHYPEAVELGTKNGTTGQLAETFKPLTGDTLRKAMTFYLHAAKYGGVTVSKNFKILSGFNARSNVRKRTAEQPVTPLSSDRSSGSTDGITDHRAKYLDLLMKRVESADGALDSELLNRIERLLGYAEDGNTEGDE